MSGPEHRLLVGNAGGLITDWPEWVSLDVRVEFELDDGTRVSTPEPKWSSGGPIDCSREELEARIRALIFAQPRFEPGDPRAEPALLVEELERHGVDATLEELAALPLAVELSDDVEAERVGQMDAKSGTDR